MIGATGAKNLLAMWVTGPRYNGTLHCRTFECHQPSGLILYALEDSKPVPADESLGNDQNVWGKSMLYIRTVSIKVLLAT